MRLIWPLLAAIPGIAHADSWAEYGASTRLRPAMVLVEASCEIDVTLRGAIAEVSLRERLTNPGDDPLAATRELELPAGAQLVALEVQHGTGKATAALAVPAPHERERVRSPDVLGADPAALIALDPIGERPRFRLIVQPFDREATITTRWLQTAVIERGALHVALPGQTTTPCNGIVHTKLGPGATVARVRAGSRESRTFALAENPVAIDVELAFKRTDPVVWTQSEALGDGFVAQAITIIAPPGSPPSAKRALFVIDGSRSMELVGRHRVKQIVRGLAAALPAGSEVDAIVYDRTARRVLGDWRAADANRLAAIDTAIDTHTASNGSDAAAALVLARQAIAGTHGDALIVLVTDGGFGEVPDTALARAVEGDAPLDLHAVVLSRGRMRNPDDAPLRQAIGAAGGSYVELDVEELDAALATPAPWLRPSWLGLALSGTKAAIPEQLRAGSGVVAMTIGRSARAVTLTGHLDRPIRIAARAAPVAPIAELALASPPELDEAVLERLRDRHPVADAARAFVVLATAGKVARSRREVAVSGGPFARMVALDDPAFPADSRAAQPFGGGSAIDRTALELMFRTQLQPAAFACYQRALGRDHTLAGTAQFRIEIGRGETTRAAVTGLGEATLDACLLDAAYLVTPPLPNPDVNIDDRTIANYPLTFSIREDKPFVIAGDADSSSPLDIDAIEGGVPRRIEAGDTSTPLGNLRPAKSP